MRDTTGIESRNGIAASRHAAATLLRGGAADGTSAPVSSGCISDISCDAIHGCEPGYAVAMKNFGDIYEQYQSYLMPRNQLLPHDYDLAARPVPAFSHLGCLNEELLAGVVPRMT